MRNKRVRTLLLPTMCCGLLLLAAASFAGILAQDDESKGVDADEFIANRPVKVGVKRTAVTPKYKATARPPKDKNLTTAPPGQVFSQLGLTIWHFRPSVAGDKTKELVEEEGGSEPTQWTLERVAEGSVLAQGQRIRLSIESLSIDGYLYVIDREEYADGSKGPARLIFPTKRTRGGDNRVKAGRVIYIPAVPNYFRIRPSQSAKEQVGEVLTVIVAAAPLITSEHLQTTSITLPREQVEAWEKQWGSAPTKFEMEGGAGQTMTDKEQMVGTDPAQELTRDDPVPQTIYRLAIKPGSPLLVTVPLRFGRPN